MTNIYDNPEEYAKETFMTLEQAKVRCEHFKKLFEEQYQTKKCPKCGKYTLEIEGGSYEEGIKEYVYCDNNEVIEIEDGEEYFTDCDFTSEVTKEYEPLNIWYGFDEILSFANDVEEKGTKAIERIIGCTWFEFVEKSNKELLV